LRDVVVSSFPAILEIFIHVIVIVIVIVIICLGQH